jgi:hypothetical protein
MPSLPAYDVMDKGYLASCPVSILSDLEFASLGIWEVGPGLTVAAGEEIAVWYVCRFYVSGLYNRGRET